MKTFITGGTGFIGSALIRALLAKGEDLKLLVRTDSNLDRIRGLDVQIVQGDIRDAEKLTLAMKGCDRVYHVAGLYTLNDRPSLYEDINVTGTRNVLDGAEKVGVERVVHTSSVAAIGCADASGLADEETEWNLGGLRIPYIQTKRRAEELALARAQNGLDVVVVNPAGPLGVGDLKPTPTGRILLSFLKGRLPFMPDAKNNFVGVDDVAMGHILAMEKGKAGERYLLGGENITTIDLLRRAGEMIGRRPPYRLPYVFAFLGGFLGEVMVEWIFRGHTLLNMSNVKFLKQNMSFSSDKARNELGWVPRNLDDSIKDSLRWFCENGYVGKRRKRKTLKSLG